jgi:CBS domain-containing protein
MSTPVITAGEETQLRDIARLLVAHRIKRVPVIRDNRIVGIVAREDLLRTLLSGDLMTAILPPSDYVAADGRKPVERNRRDAGRVGAGCEEIDWVADRQIER